MPAVSAKFTKRTHQNLAINFGAIVYVESLACKSENKESSLRQVVGESSELLVIHVASCSMSQY